MTADAPQSAPLRPAKSAAPSAPPKLGTHGRKLWRSMVETFEFERAELVILEAACRQRDDIAALEELLRDQGMTVKGSMGQVRLHPAATEVRLARGTLTKLLGELKLPDEEPAAGAPAVAMNARSRRAQAAAQRRWSNWREHREGTSSG